MDFFTNPLSSFHSSFPLTGGQFLEKFFPYQGKLFCETSWGLFSVSLYQRELFFPQYCGIEGFKRKFFLYDWKESRSIAGSGEAVRGASWGLFYMGTIPLCDLQTWYLISSNTHSKLFKTCSSVYINTFNHKLFKYLFLFWS